MSSRIAYRAFRPAAAACLGAGLALHPRSPLCLRPTRQLCEGGYARSFADIFPRRRERPTAPVPHAERSAFDPMIYRQISTGSCFGVAAGWAAGMFGKSITVVVAALFLLVEALAQQGVDVIPYGRIRKWVGNVDVKSAFMDNTAFKVSFGSTFILMAFYTR